MAPWLEKGFDTANHLVKWGGIVWVTYYLTDMISSLAGQTTQADIDVAVQVATSSSHWVLWLITLLALLAILWRLRQRNL